MSIVAGGLRKITVRLCGEMDLNMEETSLWSKATTDMSRQANRALRDKIVDMTAAEAFLCLARYTINTMRQDGQGQVILKSYSCTNKHEQNNYFDSVLCLGSMLYECALPQSAGSDYESYLKSQVWRKVKNIHWSVDFLKIIMI